MLAKVCKVLTNPSLIFDVDEPLGASNGDGEGPRYRVVHRPPLLCRERRFVLQLKPVQRRKTFFSCGLPKETDKRVSTPIPFVCWFCLQNMCRRKCCRARKAKFIGDTAIAFQCPFYKMKKVVPDKSSVTRCWNEK